MKTSNFFKQNILFLAMGLTTVMATAQNIITIDNNVNSTTTYTTIQDAYDNASPGDTIYVQPSPTSYGNVTIEKAITIIGRSHSEPDKRSQIGNVTLLSSDVSIKGLYFGSLSTPTYQSTNPLPYTNIAVMDNNFSSFSLGTTQDISAPLAIDGIAVRGNVIRSSIYIYNVENLLLSNNVFESSNPLSLYHNNGNVVANNVFKSTYPYLKFYFNDATQPAVLFNNMFLFNQTGDVEVRGYTSEGTFSNSLTYNFGGGQVSFAGYSGGTVTESNTLANTDPQFTDVDPTVYGSFADNYGYDPAARLEDDLSLQPGSPALTAGVDGDEIGLYANGYRYQVLGNPSGIPLLDITSYDAAVPKNGNINVTITAKAN